jgi:hypothetical protein
MAGRDISEECVTCREVNMQSAHLRVCEEALERRMWLQVQADKDHFENLTECSILQPFVSGDGYPAVLLCTMDELPVEGILREAADLMQRMGAEQPEAIHLWETTNESIRWVRTYCEAQHSGVPLTGAEVARHKHGTTEWAKVRQEAFFGYALPSRPE